MIIELSLTCAVCKCQAQLVPAEEDGGPSQVQRELNGIHAQSCTVLLPTTVVPDQPRGCSHEGVQNGPDNRESNTWRLPAWLPEILVPVKEALAQSKMPTVNKGNSSKHAGWINVTELCRQLCCIASVPNGTHHSYQSRQSSIHTSF